MTLKKLFTWCIALMALTITPTFTSCGSDDDAPATPAEDEVVDYVADEWVGTWKFSDFDLIFTKQLGQYSKTDGSDTFYNFLFTYNKTKNVMSCTTIYTSYAKYFTIKDIHLDSDGNLVITHNFNGTEKTETGVKQATEEKPADRTYSAPEKMVGKWVFSDYVITVDSRKNGIIEYSDGSNMLLSADENYSVGENYTTFEFMYSPSRNVLYGTTKKYNEFTFKNISFSDDGLKMTVTHNIGGTEKTETATKQTFSAYTKDQFVGKWMSKLSVDKEYFNFSEDGTAVLYGEETYTGTWRTDGYSIFVTLKGKDEVEFARYINIYGNIMTAQVTTWFGTWMPYVVERADDGGNEL